MPTSPRIVSVLLPQPLPEPFDYELPEIAPAREMGADVIIAVDASPRMLELARRHAPGMKTIEDALERYVDGVLRAGQPSPFADELQKFTARIAPFGFRNSLSQLALKFTAPGVPDLYQGCEQWNFSLVDPDNRRPVNYAVLARDLTTIEALYRDGWPRPQDWQALQEGAADGRIKQLVTWRLLQLRRQRRQLFRDGGYLALAVEGGAVEHAVAFARVHEREAVLVVAARLTWTLCEDDDGAWAPALCGRLMPCLP